MELRILKYLLGLFLVGIGVVIGIAIHHYHNMPLMETINIVDIATLVTTIFLAVYIPEVLDRKLQVKRDKKELIEKRIDELQAFYRRINLIVQQDNLIRKDFLTIKNTLDVCVHRLDTITTLIKFSNMKTSFHKEIAHIQKLSNEHKNLLWFENMDSEGFEYPIDTKVKEEALYNKIDKETSLLVFKISEA